MTSNVMPFSPSRSVSNGISFFATAGLTVHFQTLQSRTEQQLWLTVWHQSLRCLLHIRRYAPRYVARRNDAQAGLSDTVLPYPAFKLSPEELGLSKEHLESVANSPWLFSPTPNRQDLDPAKTQAEFDAGTTELPGPLTASSPGYSQHQVNERPPIPCEEQRRVVREGEC